VPVRVVIALLRTHEQYKGEQFVGRSQNCEKGILASSCLTVRLSTRNNSVFIAWINMKFYIRVFFENLSRKFNFYYNRTRIKDTLHEDQYTFCIISRSVHLRMRNVSDKSCRKNKNTHFMFSIFFFRKSCTL